MAKAFICSVALSSFIVLSWVNLASLSISVIAIFFFVKSTYATNKLSRSISFPEGYQLNPSSSKKQTVRHIHKLVYNIGASMAILVVASSVFNICFYLGRRMHSKILLTKVMAFSTILQYFGLCVLMAVFEVAIDKILQMDQHSRARKRSGSTFLGSFGLGPLISRPETSFSTSRRSSSETNCERTVSTPEKKKTLFPRAIFLPPLDEMERGTCKNHLEKHLQQEDVAENNRSSGDETLP